MYSIPEWKHVKPWLQRVNPWLLLAPVASVLGIIGANALGWD